MNSERSLWCRQTLGRAWSAHCTGRSAFSRQSNVTVQWIHLGGSSKYRDSDSSRYERSRPRCYRITCSSYRAIPIRLLSRGIGSLLRGYPLQNPCCTPAPPRKCTASDKLHVKYRGLRSRFPIVRAEEKIGNGTW